MAELEAQTGLSREELVAAMESAYTVESISQPVHGAKEDAHIQGRNTLDNKWPGSSVG